MSGPSQRTGVVPACLSFLAIYNPSLGRSEDSLEEQIVYYHSKSDGQKKRPESDGHGRDGNERLRQIGLAQGMIEFAKSFSNGESVDSIETEKSRIILHELEKGWWILASIDLTRLISTNNSSSSVLKEPNVEYSAREVCPPALLLQHLLRAHRIFLLHHASSLSELFVRTARNKFCSTLKRFWNDFIRGWDVLLSGNPAVDVVNGLKLAAGGELGIGVGEEEWGSGEREVLEDFIGRTQGLVDLLVSRFGNAPAEECKTKPGNEKTGGDKEMAEWRSSGQSAGPSDGVVFSGIGAVSRLSIRTISQWLETLYTRGSRAYGVGINSSSANRQRRDRRDHGNGESANGHNAKVLHEQKHSSQRQRPSADATGPNVESSRDVPATIPPSIIGSRRTTSQTVQTAPSSANMAKDPAKSTSEGDAGDPETGTETMIKYLTLGVYGSKWGIPFNRPPTPRQKSNSSENMNMGSVPQRNEPSGVGVGERPSKTPGHFLIGFQGELEGESGEEELETETREEREDRLEEHDQNGRIMLRTLHVESIRRQKASEATDESAGEELAESVTLSHADRLQVIVYIRQPFMFVFLFELHTDSLAIPAFYRSIHHQLGPLRRPLLTSTSPQKVSERLSEASLPKSTASTKSSQPICDLVYDPTRLTVHSTIPNIPEPSTTAAEGLGSPDPAWNRVEALNVHSQILNIFASTRRRTSELERTCKTSRGWWVVWMRLPTEPQNATSSREAFLIRKASDYTPPAARKASGRFGRDVSGSSATEGWGPGKLAEGIGIDARQYIEGLLSLNR